MQEFIKKLEQIPRLADQTVESDVRFEPLLTRILDHINESIKTHVLGDETVKYVIG